MLDGLRRAGQEDHLPMRLHECDAHPEGARLRRDQGDLEAARRHVARARELVEATGYGRRGREVG